MKLLRVSFGWDAIEEEKDEYNWHFWDEFVRMAVDEYGITLIPYVCYTPRWNATRQDDMEFWRSVPQDIDEFGEFMGDLVNRYKDRIETWELWNEPDIEWYWMGDQESFARLLASGSAAVKRADPGATVVLVARGSRPSAMPAGVAVAIPEGYAGLVLPRSGLAAKHGVTVLNSPGTIDADYRGEVKVILVNLGDEPFTVARGERIAQLVVAAHARVRWKAREALEATARGAGGFGHTGRE